MYLVNASSSSTYPQNLTKDVINSGARMFLYLNTCPKYNTKYDMKYFFEQVFSKEKEPTNTGIILYTLNAMKLFSTDGRIIALKVLEKVSTLFKMPFLNFEKRLGIATQETTKGKLKIMMV